ncbi:MAG: TonB-dependent receptor [Bacteroidales bacterium]|nr:TonB-dependent receptor [Bacteroidales bacterium]
MKRVFLFCLFSVFAIVSFGQNGTIRGFVYNQKNGEPIMFANIVLENTTMGASTDDKGYFVISKVKQGEYTLTVQSIGFATKSVKVQANSNITSLNIELEPMAQMLEAVEVQGERESARIETQVSVKKITASEIQKMPSVGGQADFAQYVQVMPGVVFSGDQGGQLYIRGGSAIQNKVLLDGMVVYNPFHSIGLFSVFETDIIRSADIYTGGFNASYGGRISSVMDISTKDGNKKTTSGKLSLSTFGASALIEGPILKEKDNRPYTLSYLLNAKNSYLSATSKSLYSYVDSELPYDFFDIYGKLTWATNQGSKLNVFGFNFTDDVKGYKNIADFNWTNMGVGASFILLPTNTSALVEGVLAYSKYDMNMSASTTEGEQHSGISSFNGVLSSTQFFDKNQLRYGVEMISNKTSTLFSTMKEELTDYSTEIGVFALFKGIVGNLLYEPSLRFSYYASLAESVLEPRLSLKYNISRNFRLKAATGMFSQSFIDTKSDRDVVNLFTGYLTAGPDLYGGMVSSFQGEEITSYLEKSNHFIFGLEYDILNNLTMNLEAYYKTMTNMISMNRDKIFDNDESHASYPEYQTKNFAVENGVAYGGDISFKYSDGRLYAWAIYSYGKVERTNETQTYAPHYDRRHNINVLVSYQMGMDRSFELSARWNYGSGFPYTATSGFGETVDFSGIDGDYTSSNGSFTTLYGELNAKRLPNYHRLDISAKKRFNIFKHSILEIDASVTNIYNRNNLFYYDRVTSARVNQLPIMPSLGLTIKF